MDTAQGQHVHVPHFRFLESTETACLVSLDSFKNELVSPAAHMQ